MPALCARAQHAVRRGRVGRGRWTTAPVGVISTRPPARMWPPSCRIWKLASTFPLGSRGNECGCVNPARSPNSAASRGASGTERSKIQVRPAPKPFAKSCRSAASSGSVWIGTLPRRRHGQRPSRDRVAAGVLGHVKDGEEVGLRRVHRRGPEIQVVARTRRHLRARPAGREHGGESERARARPCARMIGARTRRVGSASVQRLQGRVTLFDRA